MTRSPIVAALALLIGCASVPADEASRGEQHNGNVNRPYAASSSSGGERDAPLPASDPRADAMVGRGIELVQQGRCDQAVAEGFDPAIAIYAELYPSPGSLIATRVPSQGMGGARTVISPAWSDAMYLRAFCLVEMHRFDEANAQLEEALALLPNDVVYSCELGHLRQAAQRWDDALVIYRAALANVEELERSGALTGGGLLFGMSLPDWRRRALRGIGFTQIELGQLDEAEETYRRVLEIDPQDEQAIHELAVIAQLRQAI